MLLPRIELLGLGVFRLGSRVISSGSRVLPEGAGGRAALGFRV